MKYAGTIGYTTYMRKENNNVQLVLCHVVDLSASILPLAVDWTDLRKL